MAKHIKSIVLLTLVFAAGAIIGVVGTRSTIRHRVADDAKHPERVQKAVDLALARRLRLTSDQQAQLQDILAKARLQMREIRLQIRPQTQEVFSNVNAQITAMLTPEQATRYQRLKSDSNPLPKLVR